MLPKTRSEKRFFIGCALAALVAAGAVVLAGVWALLRWYSPPQFAAGVLTSERTTFTLRGNPVLRRDDTYLSSAPFNEVYTWYSSTFALGPESHGQGQCILMARSWDRLKFIREDVSVTLCDTPAGRRVVMSRYLIFRVR